MSRAAGAGPLISIVEDDESVRESLPDLLAQFGFRARTFASAEEFLGSDAIDSSECLILDVGLPGMSGPDLQLELQRQTRPLPVVFITALADPQVRQRVLAQGAIDCLGKPFSDTALHSALQAALGSP